MGRKLFLNHLANAGLLLKDGIHDVLSPDEGIVAFTYVCPTTPSYKVNIQACATDLGEYPDGNSFMLCTEDDTTEPIIPRTLQSVTESAHGKSLIDILSEVSQSLTLAISTGSSPDDTSNENLNDDDGELDFDFEDDSDNEFFSLVDRNPVSTRRASDFVLDRSTSFCEDTEQMEKIRADLNMLKNSGFRVGVFGNLTTSGLISVSIRVSKLGLSEETLEAWGIPRKRYLVLLVRYIRGYHDATKVADDKELKTSVQMRVGLCQHYKPSLPDVLGAFQGATADTALSKPDADDPAKDGHAFEPLFVGRALNEFLEERLFKIIFARDLYNLSWLGAEKLITERQASAATPDILDLKPYECDDLSNAKSLPPIVLADHLRQVPLAKASLPLLMMQFVLRHVVRCTEFCLVCHCRVDDSFEAMKPYVCLKPLCLYQYMALGVRSKLGMGHHHPAVCGRFVGQLLLCSCIQWQTERVARGDELDRSRHSTPLRFFWYKSGDLPWVFASTTCRGRCYSCVS